MIPRPHLLAGFILFLAFTAPAAARSFQGVVSHISDGDTLWVRPASGGAPRAVRLQGLDAPEICQSHGKQSRDALSSRVLHQPVVVNSRARDSFQRTVGRVSLGGHDVGAWMVGRGHAWSYRYRGKPGPYAAQESQARSGRLGLWGYASPVEPRVFRKRHGSCR